MMLRSIGAFLRRDIQTEVSYRLSFVLQILGIFPSVLLFYFLSRFLDDGAKEPLRLYGGSYYPFVLIGIAVQNYFSIALSGYSGSIRDAQLSGTLEAVLSTPVSVTSFLFGSALYAFVFNSFRIILYLVVGCLVGGMVLDLRNIPGAILAVILSIAAFSGMGIVSAGFIILFKKGNPLNWILNVTSWLLGGVYYPVSVLPQWLQKISAFIPMTHTLEALRILLLGQGGIRMAAGHLLCLAIWAATTLPLGWAFFVYALNRARAKGSIGHY